MEKRYGYAACCVLLWVFSIPIYANTISWHLNGWYPTAPQELATTLKTLDTQAQKNYGAPHDSEIRALIAPHAGYRYSGAVAAAAYRLLDKTGYTTVIVIAPSHTATFDGIALSSASDYKLPNGDISLDTTAIQKLADQKPFSYYDEAFALEHAIEVQLPLLYHYLTGFKLIPLIIGSITNDELATAATALKELITDKTLVVVSSDFTHYGKRFNYTPFADQQSARIKQHDNQALTLIQQGNPQAFADFITTSKSTICGHQAITLLLDLIDQHAWSTLEPRITAYAQSNPHVNNQTENVSYAAVTFTTKKLETLPHDQQLNTLERNQLLAIAHHALATLFSPTKDEVFQPIITPVLRSKRGAFVTLKTPTGDLRGCIGNIIGIKPLAQTINDLVADAALRDTRFMPVTAPEAKTLAIELSILTTPRRIASIDDIKLGTHGIIVHHNLASAVYLPEVAIQQGWDLPTTLDSLSEKAGLPAQAWHDKETWFEVFESTKII